MTSTTSCRTILAFAAGAAATTPALAFPIGPHPDAELLALGEEFKEARAIAIAANDRVVAKDEEYAARCVPVPDACRPKRGDIEGLGLEGGAYWRGGSYDPRQVDRLRNLKPDRQDFVVENADGMITLREIRRPNDLARAQEIIKAFDEWVAADEAVAEETGCNDRDGERHAADQDQMDVEAEIITIPAKTIEGARVKALVAIAYGNQTARPIADDPVDPEDMLYQLAWDILEISGQSPGRS